MRRRRSKPVSMMGALLVEMGTMLALIAIAQPTWTRNLIEQVGAHKPISQATGSSDPSINASPLPTSMHMDYLPVSDTVDRVAQAAPAWNLPAHSVAAYPPANVVFPPTAGFSAPSTWSAPTWGNSY